MLEELKWASYHWSEETSIGQIVLKYAPDLVKAYPPFVNFFENMKDMLVLCDREKPRWVLLDYLNYVDSKIIKSLMVWTGVMKFAVWIFSQYNYFQLVISTITIWWFELFEPHCLVQFVVGAAAPPIYPTPFPYLPAPTPLQRVMPMDIGHNYAVKGFATVYILGT